ncbi:uncharacterized protein F5147DRAFT_660757 [Suillus discolor]|uniref:Uncharacterized protein n=1 Tax=Suillus discolor TaxID=1912936 RepID=A0A9P7EQ26_9AGAM|nr:uncharacterized protein F5147DRAFT_660757 [Suillus discolor]KAG2081585.1 hypothetical protein F5147DRAFT_660757 [Suillus discolor]
MTFLGLIRISFSTIFLGLVSLTDHLGHDQNAVCTPTKNDQNAVWCKSMKLVQYPHQEKIDELHKMPFITDPLSLCRTPAKNDQNAVQYESVMMVQYPRREKIDEDWNAVPYESMMMVEKKLMNFAKWYVNHRLLSKAEHMR